jgi:hypothetical protein
MRASCVSQNLMDLSCPAVVSISPPLAKTPALTDPVCAVHVCTLCKKSRRIRPVCPFGSTTMLPVATSYTLSAADASPGDECSAAASNVPSALSARVVMASPTSHFFFSFSTRYP